MNSIPLPVSAPPPPSSFLKGTSPFPPQKAKRRNPSRTSKTSSPPPQNSGLTGRSFLSLGLGWLLVPPVLDPNPCPYSRPSRHQSPQQGSQQPPLLLRLIRGPSHLGRGLAESGKSELPAYQPTAPVDKGPGGSLRVSAACFAHLGPLRGCERHMDIWRMPSAAFCPTCMTKEDIAADPLHFNKIFLRMLCRSLITRMYQALC